MATRNVTRLASAKHGTSPTEHYNDLNIAIDSAKAIADLIATNDGNADEASIKDAAFLLYDLMSKADKQLDALWESTQSARAEGGAA